MSRIRGKDTTPERIVRSLLHRMVHQFRLHRRLQVKMRGPRCERKAHQVYPRLVFFVPS